MKRVGYLSILVLSLAFPLVAQTSASGSFNFKRKGRLADDRLQRRRRRTIGGRLVHLTGPTLVSDGDLDTEDPKQTILVKDFTMKVTVDCMSALGTLVTMSGTVSDSNVRSMIGRIATLTVQDNDLNEKDPTDRFTFGSYQLKDITWFPTDAEVKGDAGWAMSWWATDAERKDDVGVQISRTRQVNCHSFPVATYDLDPISEGRITVK